MSRLIFFIYWFLIIATATFAQVPVMQHYSVEDGLPSSNVYSCFQDEDGYIWVCTDKGLARFDGYNFKVFSLKDGLPSNDIWEITLDKKGRMWLGTFNGLVYYKDGAFQNLNYKDGDLGEPIMSIHQIDSYERHFVLDLNEFSFYYLDDNDKLRSKSDYFICPLVNGGYLVEESKNEEFFKEYRSRSLSEYPEHSLLCLNDVYLVDEDKILIEELNKITLYDNKWNFYKLTDTKLMGVHEDEAIIFESNKFVKYKVKDLFNHEKKIIRIQPIDKNHFLSKGVNITRVYNNKFQLQNQFNFLDSFEVNSIVFDKDKNSFISTKDGLYFLSGKSLEKTSDLAPDITDNITSMCFSEDNTLFMGTSNGLVLRLKNGKVSKYNFPKLFGSKISVIKLNKRNNLFIGGKVMLKISLDEINLLFDKNIKKQESYLFSIGSHGASIKSIIFNKEDVIFSNFNASFKWNEDNRKKDFVTFGSKERAYGLVVDSEDKIWFGQKSGISYARNDSIFEVESSNQLFQLPVNDLQIDRFDNKWVGTDGYGLFRFNDETVDAIHEVKNAIVTSIFIEDENNVWMTSNQGIISIKISNQYPLKYSITSFTTSKGLRSNEVNKVIVKDSTIYAGTKKGLSILDFSNINHNERKPNVFIEKIMINGNKQPLLNKFDRSYKENSLDISFICLSYHSDKKIKYHYKMEGIHKDWITTMDRDLRFPILPPNTYTFHLKATDLDGEESAPIQPIVFVINVPWWKTIWFRLFGLSLFLISGFSYLYFQRIKLEEENTINKRFAELELKALQAQMNPHFIFNSLHAIQEFVLDKNDLVANAYLVKFSRLMRLFLESSKENYILLESELNLLKWYIELEQLRFEDQFDYKIYIDDNVEPTMIEIPSMMIQPFIENAINHGLVYKKVKGKLNISFTRKDNFILCTIEDDGIGRKLAAELKQKSYKSYKSRGMQITEERRKVINFIESSNINIHIKDLQDSTGKGIGTKVDLQIPIRE